MGNRSTGALRQRWQNKHDTAEAAARSAQLGVAQKSDGEVGVAEAGAVAGGAWSAEEDAQLRELVTNHGVGNWHAVSADFASSRSSDALRHRWTKLEKQGGGWSKGPDSLGRVIMLWTAAEDANLNELVAKHGAGNWEPISA